MAIVYPLNLYGPLTSLAQSNAVNVSVWPTGAISCTDPDIPPAQQLVLGIAHDNDPVAPVGLAPEWVVRYVQNVTHFATEEFDDIPANLSADPAGKYSFVVIGGVLSGGSSQTGNVWVHAVDARTYYPQPLQPTGFTLATNPAVDLRIQVVFPHDAQGNPRPVNQAPLANIAVDIFEHGTTLSVRPDFLQTVPSTHPVSLGLQIARNNEALVSYSGSAQQIEYAANGQQYPRWVFNDVPVDPMQQYHFIAIVNGIQGGAADGRQFPNIWTHAADARTYLPYPQNPPGCS